MSDDRLAPIADSVRSLGLSNALVPFFLTFTWPLGYSANGRFVVVTTANNSILTFAGGRRPPGCNPVTTMPTGLVTFAVDDPAR